LRDPSPRGRAWTAVSVGVVAAVYFVATAALQGRDLFPKTHDDLSYLLQIRMLAAGRLWMPAHPLADHFDAFYVITRPVYGSMYFPGAALMYVPTAWLDLPTWLLPATVAGAVVGLVYRVVAELVDGVAGLLAGLGVASLSFFRMYSVLLTSHEPTLLLGLLLAWGYLRWRRSAGGRRGGWCAFVGAAAGWAAITRPADAVCFALPVGVAMLLDLLRPVPRGTGVRPAPSGSAGRKAKTDERREHEPTPHATGGWRGVAATLLLLVVGAAPFLALQGWMNVGVTGRLLGLPYALYHDRDQPGTGFGFHRLDPSAEPASVVPQKRAHYATFYRRYAERHQPDRVLGWWGRLYLPLAADAALPGRAALVLLPVGLLGLSGDRRRWAVAAALPLLLVTYFLNTFFLEHYALAAVPAAVLLATLGMRQLAAAAGRAWGPRVFAGLAAGFVALCLSVLPETNAVWAALRQPEVGDETFKSAVMTVRAAIPTASEQDIHKPAIVLVRWAPGADVQAEPVYNVDTVWPDDAAVIFAHDLGPERNRELFRYYAAREPGRTVYVWDRSPSPDGKLRLPEPVGTVGELAGK
ncbi:MAG TPA: glycosyltransferase family 39 protein, partial [Humisphaera sp.]